MEYRKRGRAFAAKARHFTVAPFLLGMVVPLLFLDVCIEIYHRVSFPLYGYVYVPRRAYIRILDRGRLQYLRWFEKPFCMYCGYANGLLPYAAKIAAETERYWCGIMHPQDQAFVMPSHHESFVPYGDAEALEARFPNPTRRT